MRRLLLHWALLALLIIPFGCSKGDDTQPSETAAPTQVVGSVGPNAEEVLVPPTAVGPNSTLSVPEATAPANASAEMIPTSTVEPVFLPADPVLLNLIDLPDFLTGVDGCEPRPRFSYGGGGGTVPWPTPTPPALGSKALELAEIEITVFRGVAARVVADASQWTEQIIVDMRTAGSIQDVNELGWALARVTGPWCDAMSLAPWPEKYDSSTARVADLLVDLSVWARRSRIESDSNSIADYAEGLDELAARSNRLEASFADVNIMPVSTGSNTLGFFLPAPTGWHVVKIGLDLRLIASYETQLALIQSTDERDEPPLAGLRVRGLRHVPGSDASQWIKNGELLFPGYKVDSRSSGGPTILTIDIEGVRAKVEILVGEDQIYYVQTICPATDTACIEFADRLPAVAEYR